MLGMQERWMRQHRAWAFRRCSGGYLARLILLPVLIVFEFSLAPVPVYAASVIMVPNDFPTIQAAVDAASPGDTIKVSSGTYTEQLVIAKNLTLVGAGADKTIVQAPAVLAPFATVTLNGAPVEAVVLITDGATVNISGLTVTGPVPCGAAVTGVRAVKDATLTLKDSHVTRIWLGSSCTGFVRDGGVGLGALGFVQFADGTFGSAGHGIFTSVVIDKYQNLGIDIDSPAGALSTATITNNSVTGGAPPFRFVAQDGIFLDGTITAEVKQNTVIGNVCDAPAPSCGRDPINQAQSAGILVSATDVNVLENYASNNDIGIYQLQSDAPAGIQENTLVNNRFFGVVIQDGDGATNQNTIKGGEVGIAVVADSQNTTGTLQGDKITKTSVMPVQQLSCCGFTATAIVK